MPEILPALFTELALTHLPYEVIISDDCSTDNSVSFLQKEYPAIKLIVSEINRGFSITINKGIFETQYEYVLLLNSDVKLAANYFAPLFRYFENEDCFGVMGRIIGWDDDGIQDGGKYPSFNLLKIKTSGNYLPTAPTKNDLFPSMYLSGANAFVNRSKLIELNGFNEIFSPFYVEDFELSVRAWRLGYKCYYEHFAVARHKISVTIKSKNSKQFVRTIYYRNKMFLHAIHLQKATFYFWFVQNFLEVLFQTLIGKIYYLKAFQLFIKEKNKWSKSRNEFEVLCNKKKKWFSIKSIMNEITDQLNTKQIQKF